jgi:dGTPase
MTNLSIFSANPEFAKRIHPESEHSFRSPFERDRDRILYSKEFRRLNRKTQVFVAGFDDHARNRLIHTLEVAQISQTIASQLDIDEALTTAIAYGHDVGHTPFGHIGERILNSLMNGCGNYRDFDNIDIKYRGFKHNWQSVRALMDLEKISDDYGGLNLTNYTLWGVLNHTGVDPKDCEFLGKDKRCNYRHANKNCKIENEGLLFSFYDKYQKQIKSEESWTLESLVVRMADEIAQRHHDIEDGLLAKIINKDEILAILTSLKEFFTDEEISKLSELPIEDNLSVFIKSASSIFINLLVSNLIEQAKKNLNSLKKKYSLVDNISFHEKKKFIYSNENIFEIFSYDSKLISKEKEIQKILKDRILNSQLAHSMDGKSAFILTKLISIYLDNPQQLPDATINTLYMRYLTPPVKKSLLLNSHEQNIGYFRERLKADHSKHNTYRYRNILMRTICDFIAGMTDDFALKQYDKMYSSKNVFDNHRD